MFRALIELCFTVHLSLNGLGYLRHYIQDSFKFRIHEQIMEITFQILNEMAENHYKMKPYVHYFPQYEFNQLKIKPSNDYCIKSDTYKYFHPDVILEDLHVVREESVEIPKQIVRELTFDGLPFLQRYRRLNTTKTYNYEWPIPATQLFMHYEHLNNEFRYGQDIMCLFQKYNHIPGKFSISHKNNLMDNFHRQLDQLKQAQKSEECLANASFIPTTYRLYKPSECQEFFAYLNSSNYQQRLRAQGPQFITKAGQEVHRGRGITVLFEEESRDIQEQYGYGTKCQDMKSNILIAQRYISNPYLYKQHKIEFRIYFTITSTDPLIVHVYKKALIKRCAKPFSVYSLEKAAHVCNTAIVKKELADLPTASNDEGDDGDEGEHKESIEVEEEEFFIDWYLEGLQSLLLEQNKINDTNWLENYLYPQVYKSIIHLVRSGEYKFHIDSRIAEFFAVDFILSDDLEIFVLECNYNPQILSVTPERIRRNYKMMMDTLEIYQAYTRSRYMRLKKFIKKLLLKASKLSASHLGIKRQMLYTSTAREFIGKALQDAKTRRNFFLALREKLEDTPTTTISPDNLYEKVIDMNLPGEAAYHNLIRSECL